MGKLGRVAIDLKRIAAKAEADSAETMEKLRGERAKIRQRIRRWQRQCEEQDPNEGAGMEVGREALERLGQRLAGVPARMERLKKAGGQKLSRTGQDSRFLRARERFVLG